MVADDASMADDTQRVPVSEPGRDYLIRSEEQLTVTTVPVPARRVRLEKFVVTERQTFTVDVSHEEFRVIDDPDPAPPVPANAGQKNLARWLYLNREEVVTTKRVVAVERVRLEISSVTEQQQVTETVRKEQFDTTSDNDSTSPPPT